MFCDQIACETLNKAGVAQEGAEPQRLLQVLLNLVSNAIKYNRPGGRVVISAWSDAREVGIDIEHTSAGLSRQQVEELLQPFNRLHDEGARTGLVPVAIQDSPTVRTGEEIQLLLTNASARIGLSALVSRCEPCRFAYTQVNSAPIRKICAE